MALKVVWTTKFKRDYKRAMKRGLDMNRLDEVIRTLAAGQELAVAHRDHALGGDWRGHRECHVQPDWLLIYYVDGERLVLTLTRTGTHADLFGL